MKATAFLLIDIFFIGISIVRVKFISLYNNNLMIETQSRFINFHKEC